ncbi:MAG: type IV-A pilus assembly ATPase PilB [Candidatus Parcubacteria bacterium]|nr:MAG: type IV-A pilus assembly ATPase PilB [Candidatus Parcubacteria bacterium]
MEKEFEEFRLDSERIAQELARALNVPYFNLQLVHPEVDALKYVPKNLAEKIKVIPIKKEKNILTLGVIDPYNSELEKLKESLKKQGIEISIGIISPKSLEIGLEEYKFLKEKKVTYVGTFEINQNVFLEVKEKAEKRSDIENMLKNIVNQDPFLILDYLLAGAIKFNASDIHFEPYEDKIFVRYRFDGILYDIFSFPKNIYPLIKNRIKILSGLMINITDKPQDGRFSIVFDDQNIDIRTSVIPSVEDEAIVLRLLIFSLIVKKLEELGLREDDLKTLEETIHLPNGLILNTGPTGSGKTTTLYAILMRIKKSELKILTIEDPIEYKIEGISQSQVEEEKGFTFAVALRAFLRHDPDVILVGEIRDKETAQITIQASLTGHLVLSTLHTNDSLGAIPRLISLEVDPKLIPSALRLVIAQRLVRKVCPYCFEEYQPDENLKSKIREKLKNLPSRVNLNDVDLENFSLVKAKGCSQCFETGYKGMIGVFEFLRITKELEELIYQKPSEAEIYKIIKNDFASLQQDALIKALRKITTIEEVERVTGLI